MTGSGTAPAPKYYRLYETLRTRIRKGDLRPDDLLPSENTLCREFRLSRGTVRKAYDALAAERLIRREQGRGIFVNAPAASLGSFALAEGPAATAVTSRLLQLETLPATPTLAERLSLRPSTPLLHVAQLQYAASQPVLYEVRYLAASLCPGLTEEMIERSGMHWLLVHHYRLPLVRVTHDIQLARSTKHIADLLHTPAGAPVFAIDRLTYTTSGHGRRPHPAVLYSAFCRQDHYQFHAEFQSFL